MNTNKLILLLSIYAFPFHAMENYYQKDQRIQQFIDDCQKSETMHAACIKNGSLGTTYGEKLQIIHESYLAHPKQPGIQWYYVLHSIQQAHNNVNSTAQQEKFVTAESCITSLQVIINACHSISTKQK